jgi:hypothetical protein
MSNSRRRQSGGSLAGGVVGLVVLLGLLSPNREGLTEVLFTLLGGLLILGITAARYVGG